ncbi:MAG: hypothetical protein JO099_00660 [Acidobacteriia bacterium]|nr:hypothetical protein [Terriglobia bacterium]
MKRIFPLLLASLPAAFAQTAAPSSAEPPLHPSFGLQDPSVLQKTPANKPVLGKAGPAPRLADGKPDLTGPWEPNAIRENVNLKATGIEPPFTPQGETLYKARLADLGKDDPEARCLPPGVPRLNTTPYPFRFVQTPTYIAILYEGGTHTWRQIFMDGRKPSQFADDLWNGESIGHWEGDTLVVETTGFNEKTWIDAAGVPHSTHLKVTERFRRLDADNMEIVNIIEDPVMYTKPWSFTIYPKRLKGELLEYICNENEKDVKHLQGK